MNSPEITEPVETNDVIAVGTSRRNTELNPEDISSAAQRYIAACNKNVISIALEYAQRKKFEFKLEIVQNYANRFQCSTVIDDIKFSGLWCSSKQKAKVSCCRIVIDHLVTVNFLNIRSQQYIWESGKNVISLVHEYADRMGLEKRFFETSSLSGFQYSFTIGESKLTGLQCSSKRAAKVSCCRVVIDYLIKVKFIRYVRNKKIHIGATCEDGIEIKNSIFEYMQWTVYSTVNRECFLHPQIQGSEKVIAGIFMLDMNKNKCYLISWATGNKCVNGEALSTRGETVNDSHAEILSRRGLLRFLYKQVEVYLLDEQKSIFKIENGTLSLRPSLSFHLYVNTAPCGDGRVFSFASEDFGNGSLHRPIFDKHKGTLRTKIEFGEGTVPIPSEIRLQTMDGIYGGERLRTMSCSDKILKWNALGLQGCLLTAFMRPIYLRSLTINQLFHYGHLSRSICCRLDAQKLKLSEPFTVNHPYLASCGKMPSDRKIRKNTLLAANWNLSDDSVEIINSRTGRIHPSGDISRLCKRSMYECFVGIEQKVRTKKSRTPSNETYLRKKERCHQYMTARDRFFIALKESGYGCWLQKPDEEKMFRLGD
ncbi:unnamed protein product [Anisakis simplex]|uniref:A to I editase domain-containing protein n=1 Tax=Anisakis simplex TaxID=6269 RepID=A0A0M3JYZ5_ANISI|nr:unnamed protein product [Anisakis simplex]